MTHLSGTNSFVIRIFRSIEVDESHLALRSFLNVGSGYAHVKAGTASDVRR
jgi:hypothetical protein